MIKLNIIEKYIKSFVEYFLRLRNLLSTEVLLQYKTGFFDEREKKHE